MFLNATGHYTNKRLQALLSTLLNFPKLKNPRSSMRQVISETGVNPIEEE